MIQSTANNEYSIFLYKSIHRSCLVILKLLLFNGIDAYIVGGIIRNLFLKMESKDCDISIPFKKYEIVRRVLLNNKINIFDKRGHYKTFAFNFENFNFEITPFRKDIRCLGRQAIVKFGDDIHKDAERRDFTVNSIYFNPYIGLIDIYNGILDCKNGMLRFIGNYKIRIKEDRLRILRFVRFLSMFPLDINLKYYRKLYSYFGLLKKISIERIFDEIIKLIYFIKNNQINVKYIELLQKTKILCKSLRFCFLDFEILNYVIKNLWFFVTIDDMKILEMILLYNKAYCMDISKIFSQSKFLKKNWKHKIYQYKSLSELYYDKCLKTNLIVIICRSIKSFDLRTIIYIYRMKLGINYTDIIKIDSDSRCITKNFLKANMLWWNTKKPKTRSYSR